MRISMSSPGWGVIPKALAVITLIMMMAGQANADHVRGPRLLQVLSHSQNLVIAMAELSYDAVVATRGDRHDRYEVPLNTIVQMQADAQTFYSDLLSRMRRDGSDIYRSYQQLEMSYESVLGAERLMDGLPGVDQRYRRVRSLMAALDSEMSRWNSVRTESGRMVGQATRVAGLVSREADDAQRGSDRRRAGRMRAAANLYDEMLRDARGLDAALNHSRPSEAAVRDQMADLEVSHRRASGMMGQAGFSRSVHAEDSQLERSIQDLKRAVEMIVGTIPSRPGPRPGDRVRVHPRAPR